MWWKRRRVEVREDGGTSAAVDAPRAAHTEVGLDLPGAMFLGGGEAVALAAALGDDLSTVTVLADGHRTSFLGPRFIAALVEEVCVRRGGYLVVVGVEEGVAGRFTTAAFRAGVTQRLSVGATVPVGVAYRRPLDAGERELGPAVA